MRTDDIARRRASKRFNERIKLLATFVGGYVLPYLNRPGEIVRSWRDGLWIAGVAPSLHVGGQLLLHLFRSED